MNSCTRRFLALNCVLHGHSILDAYDGNLSAAADGFVKGDLLKMQKLVEQLDALQKEQSYFADKSPLVLPFINFLRSQDYAFVFVPGAGPVYLHALAVSDRAGDVAPSVISAVMSSMIKDIDYVDTDKEISIVDGKLFLPRYREQEMRPALMEAYRCYCRGPFTNGDYSNALLSHRDKLTLEGYRDIPASVGLSILQDLLDHGVPPTDYTLSTLTIPDYFQVYQKTGTILGDSPDGDGLLWLLDVMDSPKGKVITVSKTVIRELIVTGLTDLSNIDYQMGGANDGLHVRS